jgi:hypothetical protein
MKSMDREMKIEFLKKIRLQAVMLQVGFKSENIGEIILCEGELESLADRLLTEHGDLVAQEEWEPAKSSLETFITLVERAIERCQKSPDTAPGTVRIKPPTIS